MPGADAAATLDGQAADYCSVDCRDAAAAIREAERNRLARERYYAEKEALRKARDEAAARRHEREYQRAIAAGGAVAANARWERLYDETLRQVRRPLRLCQWEDEDGSGEFTGRRLHAPHTPTSTAAAQPAARAGVRATAPGEGASFDVIPHPHDSKGVSKMFGLKKKGPSRPTGPFAHAEGCKIVVADPGFEPEWQEIEEGHWRRICQC